MERFFLKHFYFYFGSLVQILEKRILFVSKDMPKFQELWVEVKGSVNYFIQQSSQIGPDCLLCASQYYSLKTQPEQFILGPRPHGTLVNYTNSISNHFLSSCCQPLC